MSIALLRSASLIFRALSVRTIFFSLASFGTGLRTIRPLRSISPRTLHDVDRVIPKCRSTSCGKTSWSELHTR